jgi:ketosteroid isomerase-like protein
LTVDANDLVAIEEIKQLKARYFRFMDTKQWGAWLDVFTEDCTMWVEDQSDVTHQGRDAFVGAISAILADAVTTHHGHMPEITIDPRASGDATASGIWAMFDYVQIPLPDGETLGLQGYGHYLETYRREADGQWRISSMRLERLRIDPA